MKAEATPLLTFIETSKQFVIPIYQRTYSWTQEECRQLWDDIIRTGENDKVKAHFIGSVMYVSDDVYQVSGHNPLLVIDGQQRLTSVTLLLALLERKLEALPVDRRMPHAKASRPRRIPENYLTNRHGKDERRFRLILSAADKDTLLAIIGKAPELPPNHSHRINDNFELFATWIDERKGDLAPLCLGLRKLLMVDVALTRGQDNPQLIFESMNSTGKELTQADLIRNYVLMGLDHELQSQLYKDHWRPMELAFGQKAYGDSFDRFVRDYLTLKTREVPNINRVYDAFKAYFRESEFADQGIGSLVADIHRYATYYCRMSLIAEPDPGLRMAFQDLKEVEVEVAFPFLLEAYADYAGERLSKSDFLQIVRLVESYVFRRSVCEIPTNSMNKTFAGLGKLIDKTRYLESTQARFLLMTSQRSFPRDDDFHREIRTRDLYNNRRKRYWLRRLENHGRKEPISVHDYQVEHIMPQVPGRGMAYCAGPRVRAHTHDLPAHARPSHLRWLQSGVQQPSVPGEARHGRWLQEAPPSSTHQAPPDSTPGTKRPSSSAPSASPTRQSRCGRRRASQKRSSMSIAPSPSRAELSKITHSSRAVRHGRCSQRCASRSWRSTRR